MKRAKFYIVNRSQKAKSVIQEVNGYEDDVCFYHKVPGDASWWAATDKNTGLRLAVRKAKKEIVELANSEAFKHAINEQIALNPARYKKLCKAYQDAIGRKNHTYIHPDW